MRPVSGRASVAEHRAVRKSGFKQSCILHFALLCSESTRMDAQKEGLHSMFVTRTVWLKDSLHPNIEIESFSFYFFEKYLGHRSYHTLPGVQPTFAETSIQDNME